MIGYLPDESLSAPPQERRSMIDYREGIEIDKGLITEAEFMRKLSAERVGYRAMLQRVR